MTSFRLKILRMLDQTRVRYFILSVIVFNSLILGLETLPFVLSRWGPILYVLDNICLTIFVIELLLKLFAQDVRFFRDAWNIFDFIIIGISLAPMGSGVSVLRALRILRVLRALSFAPRLRRVIEGFIVALPGMSSVFLLMSIIFYIGSVMATKLFGATFPDWFGNVAKSAYSLFQIMTLESWSMGIVRPVMLVYPYAWMFFVPFILVTTFAVVNLLVGLIVNSMYDAHHEEANEATDAYREDVMTSLRDIEQRLSRIESNSKK